MPRWTNVAAQRKLASQVGSEKPISMLRLDREDGVAVYINVFTCVVRFTKFYPNSPFVEYQRTLRRVQGDVRPAEDEYNELMKQGFFIRQEDSVRA